MKIQSSSAPLCGALCSCVFFVVCIFAFSTNAQTPGDEDKDMQNRAKTRDQKAIDEAVNGWWKESMKNHEQRIKWWREAKFGMFVHWGIYSLPGGEWKGKKVGGYAEHLMRKEKITRAEYLDLAHQFNPVNFNADEWISTAKKAGMHYFVITAKHHDGFAMYDSKVSDFNIIQQTPFKRDPMAELAAACRKYGVKFGFYYSHAFDWEHPDAPGNDWEYNNPGGDLLLHGGRDWFDASPHLLPKAVKYVDEKAIPQIRELLEKYKPDILWFDTPHKLPLSENLRILKAIREVDNNVVVNGRLARTGSISFGDYKNTADRPAEFYPVEGDWEAIPTTNESYGYSKYDLSHKSPEHFIQLMANAASRGGNLLMNLGPMGDGKIDPRDLTILKSIEEWMNVNSESIHGTTKTPLPLQSWGPSTLKNQKLYLHVFQWPADKKLIVGGLKSKVKKAYLLADLSKKPLEVKKINKLDTELTLPAERPDRNNSVIVLEMSGNVNTDDVRLITCNVNRLLAFDATDRSAELKFGDGKTNRHYVEGWNKKGQYISWKFRVNEDCHFFDVKLKYMGNSESGGKYQIKVNDAVAEVNVPIKNESRLVVEEFTPVPPFKVGVNTLTLEITEATGSEIMKVFEVELVHRQGSHH